MELWLIVCVKPDAITYTTLIDGLFKVGKSRIMLTLFTKMKTIGKFPGFVTYSTLLNGLCKNNQPKDAVMLKLCSKFVC